MDTINFFPLALSELDSFFNQFDFSQDSQHIQQYLGVIQETSYCYQNIIHEAYDIANEKPFGFSGLRVTHEDIDGVPGIMVDFLYLKPEYRGSIEEFSSTKYSSLLLDYIIETAINIQRQVAVNHVYLVPINEKVRKVYADYGFENLPGSGSNEYEDYMVFNLLNEDPTIQ